MLACAVTLLILVPRLILSIGMLVEPIVFDNCDRTKELVPAGSLGPIAPQFPWIGVLRPLRPRLQSNLLRFGQGGTMVILVRDMFAIGVADDLMRLPKYLFKGFASIMFQYHGIRSYKMISCIPHPEYDEDAEEGTTVNAMALLQVQPLDPGDLILRGPIAPVCLRRKINVNRISEHLYAVLYNKKNFTFEKSIYSMKHMQTEDCQRFYSKGGLTEEGFEPISLLCAHSRRLQHSCVWESGVALVSNATGPWILVGLGTKSLGCANPTRFIDIDPYTPWIEAVTTSDKWKEVLNRRFAMDHKGHLRQKPLKELEIPDVHRIIQGMYPFDTDKLHDPFGIYQFNQSMIDIFPIPGEHGLCSDARNEIIYQDVTELVSPTNGGSMEYKLSMYDDEFQTVTCTKVNLEALNGDDAIVYTEDKLRTKTGAAFEELGDTPDEVLNRVFLNPIQRPLPIDKDPTKWKPGPPMKVQYLTDKRHEIKKRTHNIYLRLYFSGEAMLHVTVLGVRTVTTTTTTTTTTSTTSKKPTGKPSLRRFEGDRARYDYEPRRSFTAPPRRFPIEEEDEVSGSTTWKPVKRTSTGTIRPTRRPASKRQSHVGYELYNIAPDTALVTNAASFTRIQLVFLFISVFATWLLYFMHFA